MILMRQHMDGVTERNAHDCRSCPYGNSGDTSFNKKDKKQGKQSSEQYRRDNQRNRSLPFEYQRDEYDNDDKGDGRGQNRILFNLAGIVNSYRGTSEIFRTKGRVLFLYLLKFFFQYPDCLLYTSDAADE